MNRLFFVPLATLVLIGAGCRSETTASMDGSTRPTAEAPQNRSSCAHPYFPLREGYSATYTNRSTSGPPSTYTMTVSNVSGNRATIVIAFENGMRMEQGYACNNGMLQSTGYVDFAAAMGGRQASIETRAVEGELLPRDMRVGSRWNARFTISMDMRALMPAGVSVPGALGVVNGNVSIAREALAQESVTVPAGTFQAMKIRSTTDFRLDPVEGSIQAPQTPPMTSYEWWVEGKGLVKTEMDGGFVSEATAIAL